MGKFNAAGLPDIVGTLRSWIRMAEGTGAFYTATENAANVGVEDFVTLADNGPQTTFDASRCSPVYGSSDTVMPASADMAVGIYLGRTA